MEDWGLGGGIVSTAAPAAAAVRLLARGAIDATGALPPERCVRPEDLFPELERRNCAFDTEVKRDPMKVGVPTEIKTDEYRVSLTPAGVRELVDHGHEVLVQKGAGEGSAIEDSDYEAQGARIVPDAETVFGEAEMVLGVKEPQPAGGGDAAARPHAVHLPAPRARPRADQGAGRVRRHLHRLRDRRGLQGPAAAARADERGGGQDRHPGRGLHAREAARRARRAARRRARAWRPRTCW